MFYFLNGNTLTPTLEQMFDKCFQYIDARNKQIISLIFKPIRGSKCCKRPFGPLLAGFGFFGDDSQFAVQETNAFGHGQGASGHGVVA